MEKVAEVYKQAVREAVAKGSHQRWGNAESVGVVESLTELLSSDEEVGAEGFDAIREQVGNVVNPSAFAQVLEGLPEDHPSHIRRPEKGKRGVNKGAAL